jgi:hypothetical protein
MVIRFIRDLTNKIDDDVVYISPVWDNYSNEVSVLQYHIYTKFSDDRSNTDQVVSAHNLRKYVRSLLSIAACDQDPFKGVQLDIPNAPSVLFKVSNLLDCLSNIMCLLDVTMDSWPQKTRCY